MDAGAPVVDAGPPKPLVEPEPPEDAPLPDDVAVDADATEGEELMQLLLREPALAGTALETLGSPDAWQVALLAQMALRRGETSADAKSESPLPRLPDDVAAPFDGGATAWVGEASLPLLPLDDAPKKRGAKPPPPLELPVNTAVRVDAVDGGTAHVTVDIATEVDFGPTGREPLSVTTQAHAGTVDVAGLVGQPLDARALIAAAKERETDVTDGARDEAVALWHRAHLIERSERTREGLLRAAWAAKRATWVVAAAMAHTLAPASSLQVAYGCVGDPARAAWLPVGAGAPKKAPADFCAVGVDLRPPCPLSPAKEKRSREAAKAWRDAVKLKEAPLVRLTVDARQPRLVWLASAALSLKDECAPFQEVRVATAAARVRRLRLPLGTAKTVVRVPVDVARGVEYAAVAAPSEVKAAAWLRSRGRYAWTVTARGELEVSLGLGDVGYAVERDVSAATFAAPPLPGCDCR